MKLVLDCDRGTGIHNLKISIPGFLLEFIPMKIGAGMTKGSAALSISWDIIYFPNKRKS
jgi:hypothetical protein